MRDGLKRRIADSLRKGPVLGAGNDGGLLARRQVAAVKVRGKHERDRVRAGEVAEDRLDSGFDAGSIAVSAVEHEAFMHGNRLALAVRDDVGLQGLKFGAGQARKQGAERMQLKHQGIA